MNRINAGCKNSLLGFTLVEISIVTVILGILASIAVVRFWKIGEKAKATEAEIILEKARSGYAALVFEGALPGGWSPGIGAASDADWRKIAMENPNVSAKGYFAYELRAGNNMYALRRTALGAYSASYDATKWLYMNLDTGQVTKSATYR